MWHEVEPKPNVRVSIAAPEDELPNLRQLIQASAAACADLALIFLRLLALEALGSHEVMDLLRAVTPQVQSLFLFAVLVEEHQVRVMVRDEVDLQSHVSVSVARLLDEAPSLRKLIQTSSGAALDLGTPGPTNGAWCGVVLRRLEAHVEKLDEVVRFPIFDIRSQNSP